MIRYREQLAASPRHDVVLDALTAGVRAAQPAAVVERTVSRAGSSLVVGDAAYDLAQYDETRLIGGGKGAGGLAAALEPKLADQLTGGTVVTTTPAPTDCVEMVTGTHPLPSATNRSGTDRLLTHADAAGADDLVVVVLTGGGSALLAAPADGLTVAELTPVTTRLLDAGAPIDDLNAVRKHLSAIKGGRLADRIAPATALVVVVSDVVENRLSVIASGPTAPDPTTYEDAHAALDQHGIAAPEATGVLEAGMRGDRPETPAAPDAFDHVTHEVIADNQTALAAAATACEAAGYPALTHEHVTGAARNAGQRYAGVVRSCLTDGEPLSPPVAVLSGGETTVTVDGDGTGGPNQEFVLAASRALADAQGAVAVGAIDTDGSDGPTNAAGALLAPTALTNTDTDAAATALKTNNAYPYLDQRDSLIRTGATGTNVNDLRVIVIEQ
jgi:Putative glycerate kinase